MKIGNRTIGAGTRPFIIAEMSGNHNHDFDNAVRIIHGAFMLNCGAENIVVL